MRRWRFVTWNVHGCVGTDGVEEPDRVARVLTALEPDVVGLQEVADRNLAHLAAATGWEAVAGVTRQHGEDQQFGNALLTRHRLGPAMRHDVSVGRFERRGVLDVRVDLGALTARVLVTHFGLRAEERRRQADLLLDVVWHSHAPLLVVLGDFNEWRPRARTLNRLDAQLGPSRGGRTFPSWLPMLRLDRVWTSPAAALQGAQPAGKGEARWASDHLPVVAEVATPD